MRVEFTRKELAIYLCEEYGTVTTVHELGRAESKSGDIIRYTRSEEYIEFTIHQRGMKEIWFIRMDKIPKEFLKFFQKINDIIV
jgi:hypothetical protein